MFVIADQCPAGIGRKRGLAGARKPEKHRRLAVGTNIGRAVHRHDALDRQQIVEDAEHAFLHLAGIGRPADQDQLLGEVDRDHRFTAAAMARWISAEAGQIDDGIFRSKARQISLSRTHQQRADEQVVPGKFVDNAHIDAVFCLRTAEQIGDVKLVLLAQRLVEIFF